MRPRSGTFAAALQAARARADSRLRAQSHGRGRRRQSAVARRARMGRRMPPHAGWFDIEWDPERRYLHNKILVPLLGDQYGIELERGVLRLRFDEQRGQFRGLGLRHPQAADLAAALRPHLGRRSSRARAAGRCLRLAAELARRRCRGAPPSSRRSWRRWCASSPTCARRSSACWRASRGASGRARSWRELHQLDPAAALAPRIFSRRRRRHQLSALLQHQRSGGPAHGAARGVRSCPPARAAAGARRACSTGCASITSTGCTIPRRTCGACSDARRPRGARRAASIWWSRRSSRPHETSARGLADRWHHRLRLPQSGAVAADRSQPPSRLHRHATPSSPASGAASPRSRGCASCTSWRTRWRASSTCCARDMARLARQNPRTADFTQNLLRRAIKEMIACFPVYRTYIDSQRRRSIAPISAI